MLGLLDAGSTLRQVVMEDFHPLPLEGVHPSQLLGVDVTEYYGGQDPANASAIVVSQVKYSPRHPDTAWTAARLVRRRTQTNPKTSVIGRLADVYRATLSHLGRDDLLAKLSIRLISNQPAGSQIASAMAAAQGWLSDRPAPANKAALLASLGARDRSDIKKILDESGLTSRQATDFLRVLRLDLGQGSRQAQEVALTEALAVHVGADLEYHTLAMKELARDRALPEGAGRAIRREDILAKLRVSGIEALTPAPPHFARPAVTVPTPDPGRVVDALDRSMDRRVVAHGGAGVGKTTTALTLEKHLPNGSVVVVFDCFAAGEYVTQAQARHTPQRALMQLSNELAIRCRLPMLVVRPADDADLWRALQLRLDSAAARMAEAGARLVIVVDAADNSIWAARRRGEASFVPDLWDLRIPEHAGLVVTARSQRLDELSAPAGLSTVELTGFDEAASAAYLRGRFPGANEGQAREFHEGSAGNPRVQFYALDGTRATSAGTPEEAVEQARRTPDEIFDDLWSAAIEQAADPERAREWLADLLCLSKPATIEQLVVVAGCEPRDARMFSRALYPGLRVENDRLTLRDEDFEDYLKSKFTVEEFRATHARLADAFETMPDDPHAADVLAGHLFQAGEHDRLLALAIEAGAPEAIADGVGRMRVYRERLRYALRVAADQQRDLAAAQLVVLAAHATKSNRAMAGVILENPSLALRHGDREAASVIWSDDRNVSWLGPVHMHWAAASARLGEDELAADHRDRAMAWMRRRRDEDATHWGLEAGDVAAACESVRITDGWSAAIHDMTRWRPLSFMADVGAALMQTAIDPDDVEAACSALSEARLPAQLKARMLASAPVVPPAEVVREIAASLIDRPTRPGNLSGSWPVVFCELAARTTKDAPLVAALLSVLPVGRPRFAPARWEAMGDHALFLRAQALQAEIEGRTLTVEDLMPQSVMDPDSDSDLRPERQKERIDSERSDTTNKVSRFVSIYLLRAHVLLREADPAAVKVQLRRELRLWTDEASRRWYKPVARYGIWARAACEVGAVTRGSVRSELREIAKAAPRVAGTSDVFVWRSMAEVAIRDPRLRELATVWIDQAATATQERPQQARERSADLLNLARTCERYDDQLAGDLYNRAIAAVEDVDEDEVGRLAMHLAVAHDLPRTDESAELAERLSRAVELCAPLVGDGAFLPWTETAERVAELHPPAGLALLTRWHDMGHVDLDEGLAAVIPATVRLGLLTVDDAIGFLPLLGDDVVGGMHTVLLDLAVEAGDPVLATRAIDAASLNIRRDLQPTARSRIAREVTAWAHDHGFGDLTAVRMLRPYEVGDRYERTVPDVVIQAEDLADDDQQDNPVDLADRLEGAWRLRPGLRSLAPVLADLVAEVAPARRVAVLNSLTSLPPANPAMDQGLHEVLRTLHGALDDWSRTPTVVAWREERLPRFLRAQLVNAAGYDRQGGSCLALIAELAGDSAAPILVGGIAEQMDRFSTQALYAVASHIGASLRQDARRALVEWSLDALDHELPKPSTMAETDRAEALSAVFWALFGHPRKDVRWRAAHAARAVIGAGDRDTASALLERTGRLDGGAYVDSNLVFYWMSARVWAHMVLARVAGDAPKVLSGMAAGFAKVALDTAWPHAAVREFARRSLLRIAPVADPPIEQQIIERVQLANRPAHCTAERRPHYGRTGDRNHGEGRLHFGIDTLPYWYGPLGNRFDLGVDDVAQLAEEWIIDRLGMSALRESDSKDPRLAHLDYSDTTNHHGALPRIETPSTTVDYHAMLLVAGELLDVRRPIVVEPYDDAPDPWLDWIERHLDALPDAWTVDLRDPLPPEYAQLRLETVKEHWPPVQEADFARMLGPDRSREIVVAAAVHYSTHAGYGWDEVSSALVSSATAPSLLRALETAEDTTVLGLPYIPPHPDYSDGEIDHGEFKLRGWLAERRRERDGLEQHDRLARVGHTTVLPGPDFCARQQVVPDRAEARLVDVNGVPRAWVRRFSDEPPPGSRERSAYAYGWSVFVDWAALLDFVSAEEMMLIVKLETSRTERSERDFRSADQQESHRAFLIEPSGTIRGFRPG